MISDTLPSEDRKIRSRALCKSPKTAVDSQAWNRCGVQWPWCYVMPDWEPGTLGHGYWMMDISQGSSHSVQKRSKIWVRIIYGHNPTIEITKYIETLQLSGSLRCTAGDLLISPCSQKKGRESTCLKGGNVTWLIVRRETQKKVIKKDLKTIKSKEPVELKWWTNNKQTVWVSHD